MRDKWNIVYYSDKDGKCPVEDFIESHDVIYVAEQNRDGQMRTLIINELDTNPKKLISVLNYDGMPITADFIYNKIINQVTATT